ncbi:hypothetical protein IBTHAUMO2_190018 [Nitrosopumilaceae archaeon]|nr:hypothetical protein [Nitrosopumilus sp.]MDA7997789.1 hypothetical protein [Nitrosopumilus sp.]CAI9831155.1 hypothetical protein IBTHAUMO2_190018 [Nitrosopumilaceae archaeon]
MSGRDLPRDDKVKDNLARLGEIAPIGKDIARETDFSKKENVLLYANLERVLEVMNKLLSDNANKRISLIPKDWKEGIAAGVTLLGAGIALHVATKWIDTWLPFK